MPGCHDVIDGICNYKVDQIYKNMDSVTNQCINNQGYLPRITSEQEFNIIKKWAFEIYGSWDVWVSLTTDILP